MLDNCADRRFPERIRKVISENTLQGNCLCYSTACRQRAEANENTKSDFRALIHLQPADYEDWDRGADEISESIKTEAYVAG